MRRRRVDLVWTGHFFEASGFAAETRDVVLALDAEGIDVRGDPRTVRWQTPIADGSAERIERHLTVGAPDRFVHVFQGWAPYIFRHPRSVLTVGRLMMETEGLPDGWLEAIERTDEVWVPAEFNVGTFTRAGVPAEKVHAVPESVDPRRFDPLPPPAPLPGDGFVFLSVVGWSRRKGWDVLVRAFLEEFGERERVSLVFKLPPVGPPARAEYEAFVRDELGRDLPGNVHFHDTDPGDDGMPRLYTAASAFVLPSRGEGWGRPYMEAMAAGLPTIASRFGGNTAFMNDENSYLVDYELVPVSGTGAREMEAFRGLHWGEPSLAQLRAALRRVFEERGEAAARGARAREEILERFTPRHTARAIVERIEANGLELARRRRGPTRRHRVTIDGPVFRAFGMAVVNRGLGRALLGTGRVDLELRADPPGGAVRDRSLAGLVGRTRPRARPPELTIRHDWPPDFSPPAAGRLVVVQPWEWWWLPTSWLGPIDRYVDEVWVPTAHVRDAFVRSGVERDRVVVVPNGVDPLRFNRRAERLILPTKKRFKFLFVGGTLWRKGADILLETYLRTFRSSDDVCLVVQDLGAGTFYRGQTLSDELARLSTRSDIPELVYLGEQLDDSLVPALYAACDCFVHPYRAEGFALPIAEAMACGLPAIVPDAGAARDYCDEDVAYLVPAKRQRGESKTFAGLELLKRPEWHEVDRDALAQAMRNAYENRREARELGARASEHVLSSWSWQRSADVALERIDALARRRPRHRARRRELSVCMIVKNEEATIARALSSVREVADELVVVDTGSKDGTVRIAEEHGARVGHAPWNDDFAEARNAALEQATKDWIFVLDADQELDPGSVEELREIVQTDALRGYLVRQRNYLATEGDVLEHADLRLFRNDPSIRYAGAVHEQVVCADPAFERLFSDVLVHHHGTRDYDRSKAERDARVLERALRGDPTDAFALTNLGNAYAVLGDSGRAEVSYLRAVALALPRRDGAVQSYVLTALSGLGRLQLKDDRFDEAAATARRALELAPDYFDARLLVADAELARGRVTEALTEYLRAARMSDGVPWTPTLRASWRAELGAAEALARLGDLDGAAAAVDRAEAAAPGSADVVRARSRLADVSGTMSARRGAGAVERGGLENR